MVRASIVVILLGVALSLLGCDSDGKLTPIPAAFLATAVLGAWVAAVAIKLRRDARERSIVKVGDIWECRRGQWTGGLAEVVRPNDSREAGPDSWEMRRLSDGRTMYMHHHSRVRGKWWLAMRDGKPMARARDARKAAALASMLFATACTPGALQVQAATADAIGRATNAAAPLLVQAYELDCSAAVDHALAGEGRVALADCRARWRPLWASLDALAAAQTAWVAQLAAGSTPDWAALLRAACAVPRVVAALAPEVSLGVVATVCAVAEPPKPAGRVAPARRSAKAERLGGGP